MTTDDQESETMGKVAAGNFGWIAKAASLAAAAVLAIFVLRPAFLFGPDMGDLIAAAQTSKTRPTTGRSAEAFPYKKAYSPKRGGGTEEMGELKLFEIADRAKDPHVRGMAYLLLSEAERGYYDKAILSLNEAYDSASPGGDRDAVAIDLATALLSNWSDPKGHERALKLSDEVLTRNQNLHARWNRAAALELLDRDEAAIQAWDDYLKLDSGSEWAEEAKRHRDDLNANP